MIRYKIIKSIIVLSFLFACCLNAQKIESSRFDFVGANKCKQCHSYIKQGLQYNKWIESKHSHSYKNLQTKKANDAARKKTGKKAIESSECLECHAPSYKSFLNLSDEGFLVEDGVQCESCHGPGSDYSQMGIMMRKNVAVEYGLQNDFILNEFCTRCHNYKCPFYSGFDLNKKLEKLKHGLPLAKK